MQNLTGANLRETDLTRADLASYNIILGAIAEREVNAQA